MQFIPYLSYAEAMAIRDVARAIKASAEFKKNSLTLFAVIHDTVEGEQVCYWSHRYDRWTSVKSNTPVNRG